MIKTNPNKFQRKIGCFLGLNDGLVRHKEALKLNDLAKFRNFIQSDSLFQIEYYVEPKFTEFNKGISCAYYTLYKSFEKAENQQNLSKIFNEFKVKIGNYKYYFLQKFYDLEIETNEKTTKKVLIQSIRKQKPYFMGLVSSFFIFKDETNFIYKFDLLDSIQKLMKLIDLDDNSKFINIFWIGFIEMLLKLKAHHEFYGDDLNDYSKRIETAEQKLAKLARDYRLDSTQIFNLNEIFV